MTGVQTCALPISAAAAAPAAPAAPAEEKAKRHRRTKAEIEADNAAKLAAQPATAPTAPAAPAAPALSPAITEIPPPVIGPGALRLFINCVPNRPYNDLTNYCWNIAKDVAKAASLEDVRIADGGPLGFGKWSGYLAQQALVSPPAGDCVIWKSDINSPIADALATIAAEVVRGR